MEVWALNVQGSELTDEEEVRKHFSQYGEIVGVHRWISNKKNVHYFIEFTSQPDVKMLRKTLKDTVIIDLSLFSGASYRERFASLSRNIFVEMELTKKRKVSPDSTPVDEKPLKGEVPADSACHPQKRVKRSDTAEVSESKHQNTPPHDQALSMTPTTAVPLQSKGTPQRIIVKNEPDLEDGLTSTNKFSTSILDQACTVTLTNATCRLPEFRLTCLAGSPNSRDRCSVSAPLVLPTQPSSFLLRKSNAPTIPQQDLIYKTTTMSLTRADPRLVSKARPSVS